MATTTDVRSEWGGELCNCAGVLGAGTAERVGAPTGACSDVMAKKDVIKEAFFVCSWTLFKKQVKIGVFFITLLWSI